MFNPFAVLAVPANHLVTWLSQLVEVPFGPYATAAAVVLGTILIRLALVPVAVAQHRADQRRSAVMRRVADLNERLKHKPKQLETELGDLYRLEGGGLARGCLPMLVQIPVFAGLYQLFVSPTIAGQTNLMLHQTLFGVPLGAQLTAAAGPQLLVFAGLLLVLVLIGYASARLLRVQGPPPSGAAKVVTRVVPYLSVVFGLFLPLAATLYLVTTTTWTLGQTVVLRHWIG